MTPSPMKRDISLGNWFPFPSSTPHGIAYFPHVNLNMPLSILLSSYFREPVWVDREPRMAGSAQGSLKQEPYGGLTVHPIFSAHSSLSLLGLPRCFFSSYSVLLEALAQPPCAALTHVWMHHAVWLWIGKELDFNTPVVLLARVMAVESDCTVWRVVHPPAYPWRGRETL